jgi:FkbM family methyltransferase
MARSAMRRLTAAPLGWVDAGSRAMALEQFSEGMIALSPVAGQNLRFFAPTVLLQQRAANLLTKEPDMIQWIDGFSSDAVLWDIGANVGVFSLYAVAQRRCKVLSFEPSAANFHVLARNVALNGLAGRIDAYCIALSGATGLGVLNLASTAMGAAMSMFGKAGEASPYSEGPNVASHGMIGFTVDQFIELFSPPFPTHIKIDVDGLELAIIEGARQTLADTRLRSVMLELSLSNESERTLGMKVMDEAGLRYVSHGESQGTDTERAANHLFIR